MASMQHTLTTSNIASTDTWKKLTAKFTPGGQDLCFNSLTTILTSQCHVALTNALIGQKNYKLRLVVAS